MGIDEVAREAIEILNSYGFETELEDKYPSWEPNIGDFAKRVYGEMKNLLEIVNLWRYMLVLSVEFYLKNIQIWRLHQLGQL